MRAYYNEFDPKAAAWLRELIGCGLIAPGDVDERSIADVRADDLKGYAQCHFFAGIGGWSHAARLAGVSDEDPIWTGSCPCPPFSAAGKGSKCPSCGAKRCLSHPTVTAGWICLDCGDEWRGDDRHLLPEFLRLIGECQPAKVFGEQVASRDGRMWVYTLRVAMEALGHAVGIADLCAAGFGAPHIRQRLFFGTRNLAHSGCEGLPEQHGRRIESARSSEADGVAGRLGIADGGVKNSFHEIQDGSGADPTGNTSRLGNPYGQGVRGEPRTGDSAQTGVGYREYGDSVGPPGPHARPRPTNGFWGTPDWLFCRDDKWRPVEPGTFPLADGVSGRVGLLRGYGNAIVPQVAAGFIRACS